jgi:hypothetical protein
MWPAAPHGAHGEDGDGSIIILPRSAVAHDPAVLGPFDGGFGGAKARMMAALERDVQQGGIAAERTAATAAAVQAIARGLICAPLHAEAPPESCGHRAHAGPWPMEASLGWGSDVSRADLQHMLDDIPAPDSDEFEDAESVSSASPRAAPSADQGAARGHGGGACGRSTRSGANYAGGDVGRGRPLADGSHYPAGEQRVIELQALIRAKDRELHQRDADTRELRAQLEHAERERDLYLSRSADWEAKARDWECENSALRKELSHAKSSVGVLETQSQLLQDQLSKAMASVNTLQLRVDELLQTDPNTTAAQYEHHLNQLRAEAHTARTDADAWRHEVADLRAILEEKSAIDSDTLPHLFANTESVSNRHVVTCDVSAQTVVVAAPLGEAVDFANKGSAVAVKRVMQVCGGRAAHLVAQHLMQHSIVACSAQSDPPTDGCASRTGGGDGRGDGLAAAAGVAPCEMALTAKVAALELEIETLRRTLHGVQAMGRADDSQSGGCASWADDLRPAGSASAARSASENNGSDSISLVAQVQHEFADLRRLNTQLVQANRALAHANDTLMAERGVLGKSTSAATGRSCADGSPDNTSSAFLASGGTSAGSKGASDGGGGMALVSSSLSPAEERHMARVRQQRQAAESEKLHAAALEDLGKHLKAQFAARETMLLEVLLPCPVCAGVLGQDV